MKVKISTRVVFLIGDVAVKIPVGRRGWIQGWNERKIWAKYAETGLLVPLIGSFGPVILQRRVEEVVHVCPITIARVKFQIEEFRFDRCDLWNPANWGRMNGEIVLLDYGIDRRVAGMY